MNANTDRPPGLTWPIKRSFLRYVAGMTDGRCSATDGAEVILAAEGQTFHYSSGTRHTEGIYTIAAFIGDVRFVGHGGMLFLRIADPEVRYTEAGEGVLSVLTHAVVGDAHSRSEVRIDLATLHLLTRGDAATAQDTERIGRTLRLTEQGAELFGGAYSTGDPLDDLTFG